jgi:hypothetical protein
LDFPDGLVVLWADNSMGKSTALKSILWALGFEAMLTASQSDIPLPPVMKSEIQTGNGVASVIESEVLLEIENGKGERIVVHRGIKGSRDRHLVTVTHGAGLTKPDASLKSEDFFVSRAGGATSERGFHQFLAGFLGWKLPEVQTFEGRQCPLYLQTIFPYIFVEQTRGWSSLQPPTPTHFRIKEVHKRAIEFLLRMDAYEIASKRQRLRDEETKLEAEWSSLIREVKIIANSVNGTIQGVPTGPTTSWPPQIKPQLSVFRDDKWMPLANAIADDKAALEKLVEQEIPRVAEIAASASTELTLAERKLRERESLLARVIDALDTERHEVAAVHARLGVLEEDLRRNKDVQILQSLGSTVAPSIAKRECPTCHQSLKDSLIPVAQSQTVMSIDENIKFVTEQRRTFGAVLGNAEKMIGAREHQRSALREEVGNLRAQIRALRQTLVSDGRLPSIAAIRSRLELEDTIKQFELAKDNFDGVLNQFRDAAAVWHRVRSDLESLPKEDVSPEDKSKIGRLSELFRDQLKQYGFASVTVNEVAVSADSYRPEHEGFDLPTNISASDFIRVIWSYLSGMLELARSYTTNHPGLLIFDEPKQQSTKDISFAELLRRASSAGQFGQQVIFATSENQVNLKSGLENLPHHYIECPGRIILPLT